MALYEILIPVKSNSGKRFTRAHNEKWDKTVTAIAGGLTKMPVVQGQWLDGGVLYSEPMTPVRIVSTAAKISKIADFTARHYRQLAVMTYKLSSAVTIKSYA